MNHIRTGTGSVLLHNQHVSHGDANIDSTISPVQHAIELPALESLDLRKSDVFYDVDLDEMTIHFYGRETPHYVDHINDVLSTLRDNESDTVVGVVFNRYLKQLILDLPESRIFFDDATILTGDNTLFPASPPPDRPPFGKRARFAMRAMKQGWDNGVAVEANDQRRRVYEAIPKLLL